MSASVLISVLGNHSFFQFFNETIVWRFHTLIDWQSFIVPGFNTGNSLGIRHVLHTCLIVSWKIVLDKHDWLFASMISIGIRQPGQSFCLVIQTACKRESSVTVLFFFRFCFIHFLVIHRSSFVIYHEKFEQSWKYSTPEKWKVQARLPESGQLLSLTWRFNGRPP